VRSTSSSRWSSISFTLLSLLFLSSFSSLALAQSAGQLAFTPWSVGFGTVAVGSTSTRPETLTNYGKSNLTITQLSVTGGAFSAQGWALPLTLSPGQSKAGTVKFAPSSIGKQSGTLSVSWTSKSKSHGSGISLAGIGSGSGQLASNPAAMNFGSLQVGGSKPWTGVLTNSASTAVTISNASVTGTGYQLSSLSLPVTLSPGQSTNYAVTFAPKSAGTFSGNLAITSNAPNPTLNVVLSGTGVAGGQLTSNPTSLSFGSVQTGSKKTLSETLTNSSTSAVTISQVIPTGTGFSFSGMTPPVTLSPNQSFTFSVTFAPISTGSTSGALSITSNAANTPLSIPLTGSGSTVTAGQLAVNPASMNFGNVTVGSTQKQTATLSASSGSVTVTSAGITTGSPFSVSGISFPVTIASGQTASFSITFAPQASGSTSSTLAFFSNASNGSVSESLAGTGVQPAQHSVTLSWNASSSSNVVGYNIYRSGQSGGPYAKINSALDPSTTDVDTSVQSGSTYYYAVTAVDSSGRESVFSNQTTAVIP
jgi:centrosomal CEP192-like protein/HYDIN/CFA65/VesB family protein